MDKLTALKQSFKKSAAYNREVLATRKNKDILDVNGKEFKENDIVARAVRIGAGAGMQTCVVTRIAKGCVYLDGHNQPIMYPGRLMIITKMYENEEVERGSMGEGGSGNVQSTNTE